MSPSAMLLLQMVAILTYMAPTTISQEYLIWVHPDRTKLNQFCDYVTYDDQAEIYQCKLEKSNTAYTSYAKKNLPQFKLEGVIATDIKYKPVYVSAEFIDPKQQRHLLITRIINNVEPILLIISSAFWYQQQKPFSPHQMFYGYLDMFASERYIPWHNEITDKYLNGRFFFQRINIKQRILSHPEAYNGLIVFSSDVWDPAAGRHPSDYTAVHLHTLRKMTHYHTTGAQWQISIDQFNTFSMLTDSLNLGPALNKPINAWEVLKFRIEDNQIINNVKWEQEEYNQFEFMEQKSHQSYGLFKYHLTTEKSVNLYMWSAEHKMDLKELANALDELQPDVIALEWCYFRFVTHYQKIEWMIKHKIKRGNGQFPDAEIYKMLMDIDEFNMIYEKYRSTPEISIIFADLPAPYFVSTEFFDAWERPNDNIYKGILMNTRNHVIASVVNKHYLWSRSSYFPAEQQKPMTYFLVVGNAHSGFAEKNSIYKKKFGLHQLFTSHYRYIQPVVIINPHYAYEIYLEQYPIKPLEQQNEKIYFEMVQNAVQRSPLRGYEYPLLQQPMSDAVYVGYSDYNQFDNEKTEAKWIKFDNMYGEQQYDEFETVSYNYYNNYVDIFIFTISIISFLLCCKIYWCVCYGLGILSANIFKKWRKYENKHNQRQEIDINGNHAI